MCLPTKIITCYPNNKPWCDNTLRQKIVNKDKAYRNRKSDPSGYRSAKNSLRKAVCAAKLRHKDRIESIFGSGDSRKLWDNMNRITNYKGHKHSVRADDVTLPDQLNDFYARFDEANNTTPTPLPIDEYLPPPFSISEEDVRKCFVSQKEHKAAGPDEITPRLLKKCNSELAKVFSIIFNWSIEECSVPSIFKLSTIIPIPKKPSVQQLNDYRPVALTSCIMKCFEKIVLKFIHLQNK